MESTTKRPDNPFQLAPLNPDQLAADIQRMGTREAANLIEAQPACLARGVLAARTQRVQKIVAEPDRHAVDGGESAVIRFIDSNGHLRTFKDPYYLPADFPGWIRRRMHIYIHAVASELQ